MIGVLADIKSKYKEGNYQEALRLIEIAERRGFLCPEVLLWKGRCLQLLDGDTSYELSDIEKAFKQALEIDEDFTPATIELAWFYLNVLDDAKRAVELFEKAVNSHKQLLSEAVVGKAKCLMEMETKDATKSYLVEIAANCLDSNELQKVIEEVESFNE